MIILIQKYLHKIKIRKFPHMIEKIFEIGGLPEFAYARYQKEHPGANV